MGIVCGISQERSDMVGSSESWRKILNKIKLCEVENKMMGDRLMVGHCSLEAVIGVRISVPQPNDRKSCNKPHSNTVLSLCR